MIYEYDVDFKFHPTTIPNIASSEANRLSPMNRAVKGMSAIIGLLVSRLPRRRVRGWGAGRDADAARDALPPDRYRELGDEGAQKDIRVVSGAHGHGQILSAWLL